MAVLNSSNVVITIFKDLEIKAAIGSHSIVIREKLNFNQQ
jgi:hypothetical protein